MGDKGSRVSVDLTAKASLEIKAEVPKESTGRTLDALVDIIRPFTEGRGLKADRIRLQRAEIAYRISEIARDMAALENLQLTPPPAKFMVPFLEKASLEEDDAEAHCRWAALLLSASTHYEAQHLTFMDMLTRLSSEELTLLEEVCLACARFPELSYPGGHMAENKEKVTHLASTFNFSGDPQIPNEMRRIFDARLAQIPLTYGHIVYVGARYQRGATAMLYTEYGLSEGKRKSLEILERERLLAFGTSAPELPPVAWFDVTFMGVRFVRDCSPSGRERSRKHAEEQKAKIVQVQPASPEVHEVITRALSGRGHSR